MNVSMYVYLNRKWNNMENPQNNNDCKYQQTYNTHSYKNAKISVNMYVAGSWFCNQIPLHNNKKYFF